MKTPCACTTVRKASRALTRYYEEALEECSISITQFSILRALQRNGPTALSELADELVMERTSLYRTIAPLQKQDAIAIEKAEHGRTKVASLRPDGERLIAEAKPHWERAQKRAVTLLGRREWEQLSATLLAIPALISK